VAIIDRFRNITTTFEYFEVPKSISSDFIKEFSQFIEESLKARPGVISFNLHYSEEEETLVNYGQWKSVEAYEAFFEDKDIEQKRNQFYGRLKKVTKTKVVFAK
tara:strand:+ start:21984 stop:22295 length:312 start_codon:yes stop_codon:yes gene_type:complete